MFVIFAWAAPFLIPSRLALLDLPGHVQRYHIRANLADSATLAPYYSYQWRFVPNLGGDLLIIPLTHLFGADWAVKIMLAMIASAMIAGMIGIAREIHGRLPAPALFALPLALSYPMTFGLVNSCLAVALALLAFGGWLRLTRHGKTGSRDVLLALIAPLLLVCHITGFGVLALLITGAAFGDARSNSESFPRACARAARSVLPMIWPLVLLLLWRTGPSAVTMGWLNWRDKLKWLVIILREDWRWFDIASAALIYTVALLPLFAPRRFGLDARLATPAALLWAAALILPTWLLGSDMASTRLIPVALMISVLAVAPRRSEAHWFAVAGMVFIALRLISGSVALLDGARTVNAELAALDHVRPRSRVIALNGWDCPRAWAPPRLQSLPSYATTERDAYVNNQFVTTEGQLLATTLRDHPALRAFPAAPVRLGPCPRFADRPTVSDAAARIPWSDIDYLWLINIPPALRPAHAGLRPLWQRGNSILYAVTAD